MVRFLADASLNHAVVAGCLRREPAIDFLSAHAARLEGVSDADVLALAARQNRIVVTHDFQTMPNTSASSSPEEARVPGDRRARPGVGRIRAEGLDASARRPRVGTTPANNRPSPWRDLSK
jgi:Domain of unknown function (DUF5615)